MRKCASPRRCKTKFCARGQSCVCPASRVAEVNVEPWIVHLGSCGKLHHLQLSQHLFLAGVIHEAAPLSRPTFVHLPKAWAAILFRVPLR